jgi:hypothetical protein
MKVIDKPFEEKEWMTWMVSPEKRTKNKERMTSMAQANEWIITNQQKVQLFDRVEQKLEELVLSKEKKTQLQDMFREELLNELIVVQDNMISEYMRCTLRSDPESSSDMELFEEIKQSTKSEYFEQQRVSNRFQLEIVDVKLYFGNKIDEVVQAMVSGDEDVGAVIKFLIYLITLIEPF